MLHVQTKCSWLLPNITPLLAGADFRTDSDIQSLTREELHELFPEPQKLKLRRNLFEIIHKQVTIVTACGAAHTPMYATYERHKL